MRFTLGIPAARSAAWRAASPTRIVAVGDGAPVSITIGALIALPDDLQGWMQASLRLGLAAGATLAVGGMVDRHTAKGWPMRLVDARVVVDGEVVETRLAAFYRFFEYGGVALARAAGAEPDPDRGRAVLDLLATAEPDWSDAVVAVHQLWEDVEPAS
ncbi:MAG: hypothetical protein H6708_28165 [Kofleriaceae bacterium]|nr:hypothetical protein [Myxococcales bacterium]MCB9564277.1 hypothetical protein [Kofleriaceae bacterium]